VWIAWIPLVSTSVNQKKLLKKTALKTAAKTAVQRLPCRRRLHVRFGWEIRALRLASEVLSMSLGAALKPSVFSVFAPVSKVWVASAPGVGPRRSITPQEAGMSGFARWQYSVKEHYIWGPPPFQALPVAYESH
jgi:hypothetical protein